MPNHGQLSISVVVPVRDEVQSIGLLLDSLSAQTRLADEIVVCDAGSADGTADIAEQYARRGLALTVLRAGPAFPGRARNLAIEVARGEIIALTDAGIRLDPGWLERLTAPFEGPNPPDVVYGRFEPVRESFQQQCISLAFVPPLDKQFGLRTPSLASLAMRRSVWVQMGGFREDLRSAEDLLFLRGISKTGFPTALAPDAVVFWSPPANFAQAFRRFAPYSYSNIRAGLAREWQIPLLRVYLLMALLTATIVWTPLGGLAPLALIGARAVKRAVHEMGIRSLFNIPVIAGVMIALAVIDLATFYGCLRWLATDGITKARLRDWPWQLRSNKGG